MTSIEQSVIPKVATLALPTREAYVTASVWPGAGGVLLFVAELNLSPQARQELTNALLSKLEHRWTELSRTGRDLPTDGVLEQVLIDTNAALKPYERLLGNPLAPRYHVVLAFLRGTDLAASAVGHCGVFIVNDDHFSNITQPEGSMRRPAKPTFEQVVTGRLATDENVVLASPALLDYFSADKLQQLIMAHPPGFSLREIEKFILGLKVHPPLGVICLHLSRTDEALDGTDGSIQHFMQTQADTSRLLKPSLWHYMKNWFWRTYKHPLTRPVVEPPVNQPPSPNIVPTREKLKHGPSLLARCGRQIGRLKWLTNRELAKTTIASWLEHKLITWQRLALTKKIILGLALIVLLAFSQSIVNIGRKGTEQKQSEGYNQMVTDITERQAAAESALIYQDDARARTLLDEAFGLLASLPQNTKQREQQWQTISKSLELTRQHLEKKITVNDLPAWVELSTLPDNASWNKLTYADNRIIIVANNGQVDAVDPSGKISTIGTMPSELGTPYNIVALDKEVLILSEHGQSLVRTNLQTVTPALPMKDAGWYDGRVYYLDVDGKNIFRATRQGNGFTQVTPWLRASQQLPSKATSLSVDGNIYVAGSNEIKRYTRGAVQEFSLQPTDPPLSGIAQVRTTTDSDYIYVWELTAKRLTAFDKQGKLTMQLSLTVANDIQDIAVDGVKREAYVLHGTTISRINLSSLIGH